MPRLSRAGGIPVRPRSPSLMRSRAWRSLAAGALLFGCSVPEFALAQNPPGKPKTVFSRLFKRADMRARPKSGDPFAADVLDEPLNFDEPLVISPDQPIAHPADSPEAYRQQLKAAKERAPGIVPPVVARSPLAVFPVDETPAAANVGYQELDSSAVLPDLNEPTPPILPLVPGSDAMVDPLRNHRPPDPTGPYLIGPENDRPTGFVRRRGHPVDMEGSDYFPVQDRYRVGLPTWDRYVYGSVWDPYNTNVLKGDYPIIEGSELFFSLQGVNELFAQSRKRSGGNVGTNEDTQLRERFFFTTDLFKNDNTFTPSPWFFRITQAVEYRDQTDQGNNADYAWQEAFVDLQLAVISNYYDTLDLKLGRQLFVSDFRGFVYADVQDMAVFSGTWDENRWQYRVMAADAKQIDPVSNFVRSFEDREQTILGADFFRQDWPYLGMFVNGGVLFNHDYFKNEVNSVHMTLAAQGVVESFQINATFVQAAGRDSFNPIARQPVNINAQMAALEVTRPTDWFVPRWSVLYASGDSNPTDSHGTGFDAVFDNPNFAGANVAFWNRETLNTRGLTLVNGNSFLPNLRTKAFDPSNFVNPGIVTLTQGVDTVLTTRTKAFFNWNAYWLVAPESVEEAIRVKNGGLNVDVGNTLGQDYTIGITYKPLIIDNVQLTWGGSVFDQGNAMEDLTLTDDLLYSTFLAAVLIY